MSKSKNEGTDVPLGEKIIGDIISNYQDLEKSIVAQLDMCNRLHPGTTGTSREDIWLQLFERIVPKKFVIEHSIFIIDSYCNVSTEIDLAIIDNSYTPYIFQYGKLKYVPIEAAAAVVECKSSSIAFHDEKSDSESNKADLTNWFKRISNLRTSRESIVRMAAGTVVKGVTYNGNSNEEKTPAVSYHTSTQTSTRPIRIFCGYDTQISKEGNNFKKLKEYFDFILLARSGTGNVEITVKEEMDNLQKWYMELDHYKNKSEENDIQVIKNNELKNYKLKQLEVNQGGKMVNLLTFNFQLNQLLMLLNNPIFFPHLAYAQMFSGEKGEDTL